MLHEGMNPGYAKRSPGFLMRIPTRELMRAIIVGATTILLAIAWTRNVNWDEFYFLSLVHANLDGRLDRPLQTVFVHAFGWLAHVPGHEMGQIFAARLVMTALFATTVFSIHRISRELTNRDAADIAVIAFLTSGFVVAHGTSFRADPIAAAFLMGALAILMTGRMSRWQIMAVALLSAGGLLVTIKAVLYLPAYFGVLVWRWNDRRVIQRMLLSMIIGLVVAAGLYAWHAGGIVSTPGNEITANASNALTTTLLDAGLFPRSGEALLWAFLSFGAVLLALLGVMAPASTQMRLVSICMVLPFMLSVLFYRNAFPYFFPYITPPLMVVAAIGAARLGRGAALGTLVVIMLATGTGQSVKALSEGAAVQRATLAEVHRLFPDPVPYIDHNGMVASFPREGFFMSSWGIARYRAAGKPVMADLIERTAPPLLLANRRAVYHTMTAPLVQDHPWLLLPNDQTTLRAAYVHYSGVIWLAGREVTLGPEPETIELAIPGRYRLESAAPIMIDGELIRDGMTLDISAPLVAVGPANLSFRLIWDTPGAPRSEALPPGPVYVGFWRLPT